MRNHKHKNLSEKDKLGQFQKSQNERKYRAKKLTDFPK